MTTNDLFTRAPDLIVTSDELMAEGVLLDPDIYGAYVKYGNRPINRWSNGARDLLRDYFASGQAPVPFWGVLADVLQAVLADGHTPDPEGNDGPPYEFQVPAFTVDPELEDEGSTSRPDGGRLWLEPNEVGGWTLLLPDEH